MKQQQPFEVTAEARETYARDGVVVLRKVFDEACVERLREAVDAQMAAPSARHLELEREGDGRFFFDTFLWQRRAPFREFVFDSPAAAVAGALMGATKVNTFFDQLLVKEPGTSEPTPWHHDLPYWPVDGQQVCTLWLALDSVTRDSGAVEYLRGSHRCAERYHPPAFAGDDRYRTPYPQVPDFEARRDELDLVAFDLEPGDCTVHHALTVHAAPGNARRDRRRRAYVTRWAGDDAVYAPGERLMPLLEEPELESGAPLDSALWPVVWRADEPCA